MLIALLVGAALRPALAQRPTKLLDLDVIGNKNVARDTILSELQSLKVGKDFTREDAIADRERLEAMGLFQDVAFDTKESTDGIIVIFRLVENPIVKSIAIEGNDHVPTTELLKGLETKVGNLLNNNSIGHDVDTVRKRYSEKGYLADVADVKVAGGDIAFLVVELKVNEVRVRNVAPSRKGLHTREVVIIREIKLKKGDLFDLNKIRRSLNRLRDLDIFEDVSFDPDVPENAPPGTADIVVSVKERRTANLLFGIASTFRNEFVGYFSLSENNWRGKAQTLSLRTEVGDRETYELIYSNPWFDSKRTAFHFSGGDRRFFREPRGILGAAAAANTGLDFQERRKGATIGFSRPQDEREETYFSVGYRYDDVSFIQQSAVVPGQIVATSFGAVSAPSVGFVRDTRDSRLDPNVGFRGALGLEVSSSFLGSNFGFQKIDFDIRKYLPIGSKKVDEENYRDVLAGRFQVGKVFGQVPVFEQYFVGGADTLRGYEIDRLYGENVLIGNLEVRHRLQKNFTAVVFVDYGSSWGGSNSNSTGYQGLFGKGLGMRIRTPFGPLRLDYGLGDKNRIHFSVGHPF